MARKKPMISLRRPVDAVDPTRAERFVRGLPVTPASSDVETPRRPDVQTSAPSGAAAASKSMVYRKRTDDLRRRMTIYLPEDLSRRLRLYAAEKDQDYSVVLAEALGELLKRKGVH